MIKINDNLFYPVFEYLYMFVMVIYMAQMTPDTGRMVGVLSGNPIPLLIPIVLTIILLMRNPISFTHRKFCLLVAIMTGWSTAVCYKLNDFNSSNLSYYFFLIYAIFIAFIHIRVYGRDLFAIYEHIMVVFSVISLTLWGFSVVFPATSECFFHNFPETTFGNNFLYLFNWTDPAKEQVYDHLVRNQGCSWEPGRFAIMLLPAILINLSRNGIAFKGNKNITILLLTLLSTMSTTGYCSACVLYAFFWFSEVNLKRVCTFLFILLPFTIYLFSLDFMGNKIQEKADFEGLTPERMENMSYIEETRRDEYIASLDRFESASFEWINFIQEPLLGYGRNNDHSWFKQEISLNFELTGGLVKIFSQYGIFVGALLYLLLFYSSFKISRICRHQNRFAFAIMLLLSSFSYVIFCVPVFTAFWLYGLFCYQGNKNAVRRLRDPLMKKILPK